MKVSVALCTYNGEKYLPEQLASFDRQTRPPDEVVVCDDRSTDGTVDLLRRYAGGAAFPVRVCVNETNLGSTKNFEKAIGLCDGDVIALSDQDDSWLPDKLARMEAAFASDPAVGLVTGDARLADADLRPTPLHLWANIPFTAAMQDEFEAGGAARLMLRYNVVTGATTAFRADLRPLLLPVPDCWVHDGWIGLIAAAVSDGRLVRDPVILYRQHGTQQIGMGKLTLARQYQSARRMNRAYFEKLTTCFDVVAERVSAISDRLCDSTLLRAVEEKVRHTRLRADMRGMWRVRRIGLAVRELLAGRYHRFGQGVKAFGLDVLM